MIAVARTADLVLMMVDAGKGDVQRRLLVKELESVGIRLNKKPPNIYFKVLCTLRHLYRTEVLSTTISLCLITYPHLPRYFGVNKYEYVLLNGPFTVLISIVTGKEGRWYVH